MRKTKKAFYKVTKDDTVITVQGWKLDYLAIRNRGPRHWIIDHLPTGTFMSFNLKTRKEALSLASSLELMAAEDGDTEDLEKARHVFRVALKELAT